MSTLGCRGRSHGFALFLPRSLEGSACDHEVGWTLTELLISASVLALILTFGLPRLDRLSSRLRVELAAFELAGTLRLARTEALRYGCHVGVKFLTSTTNGGVRYVLHRDGDGDGVRTEDISSGVDEAIGPERSLRHLGGRIGLSIPAELEPSDPGDPRRRLRQLDDPIRFNRSDIAAFGPLGTSTPGSLYVSDGARHLAVVRVFNRSGKVKVLRWDAAQGRWRRL